MSNSQRLMPRPSPRQWKRLRAGAVTLEFLVGFVAMFIVSLAIFQFFMIGITQQLLATATTEAARFGAMRTVDESLTAAATSATKAAEAYLHTQGLELLDQDPQRADGVMVVQRRFGDGPTETMAVGDGPSCPPQAIPPLELQPNQLRVTLCFPLVDATQPSGIGNPVGNWLGGFGFDIAGSRIRYSTVVNLE